MNPPTPPMRSGKPRKPRSIVGPVLFVLGILVAAMMLSLSRWPSTAGDSPRDGHPGGTNGETTGQTSDGSTGRSGRSSDQPDSPPAENDGQSLNGSGAASLGDAGSGAAERSVAWFILSGDRLSVVQLV